MGPGTPRRAEEGAQAGPKQPGPSGSGLVCVRVRGHVLCWNSGSWVTLVRCRARSCHLWNERDLGPLYPPYPPHLEVEREPREALQTPLRPVLSVCPSGRHHRHRGLVVHSYGVPVLACPLPVCVPSVLNPLASGQERSLWPCRDPPCAAQDMSPYSAAPSACPAGPWTPPSS